MRRFFLVVTAVMLACGSSNSGNGGSGMVDPASLDFCLHWANDVCRNAYLCVDAASRDDTFRARYGSAMDNCGDAIVKLCTSNQTGAQAFGPSCGPGKTVNDAVSKACTDHLESEQCVEWLAAQAGNCEGVCAGAPATDGGTTSLDAGSRSDAPAATDAGTTSVPTAVSFCVAEADLTCDRAFECQPSMAAAQFGNVAGCKTLLPAVCGAGDPCPGGYDPNLGAACIAATMAASCQELMGPAPVVCTSACN